MKIKNDEPYKYVQYVVVLIGLYVPNCNLFKNRRYSRVDLDMSDLSRIG